MYYLTLISDKPEHLQFCKTPLPAHEYLISAISWDELLDQENQLRKSDVVIVDLSDKTQDITNSFSQLQQEIKLYEMEVALLLLITPATLEQLSRLEAYDDFILLELGENQPSRTQKELATRLKLILKNHGKEGHQRVIQVHELAIDLDKYEVRKAGQTVSLTFKEYELLKYLITHPDRVFTRESLLNAVWGYDYYGGTRTVDVHIRRIRSKLGDEEENYIKTVWGVGYRFIEIGPE